jgi:hypothetical protein
MARREFCEVSGPSCHELAFCISLMAQLEFSQSLHSQLISWPYVLLLWLNQSSVGVSDPS